MIEVFQALADPRRLEILEMLRRGELRAGEIAARFEVARPTVSHHLSVLAEAGLLSVRQDGTRRFYAIHRPSFEAAEAYLATFWRERLARLKVAAESHYAGTGRAERN